MSASVVWSGLTELIADLRNLPAHLRDEAGVIVVNTADEARVAIRSAYAEGTTGNLRRGLLVKRFDVGTFGVGIQIQSTAPHAWLYEHGSAARRSKFGNRGSMPARPVFGGNMSHYRRVMYQRLATMMRGAGLTQVIVHAA